VEGMGEVVEYKVIEFFIVDCHGFQKGFFITDYVVVYEMVLHFLLFYLEDLLYYGLCMGFFLRGRLWGRLPG
jgi:hypothetical protein